MDSDRSSILDRAFNNNTKMPDYKFKSYDVTKVGAKVVIHDASLTGLDNFDDRIEDYLAHELGHQVLKLVDINEETKSNGSVEFSAYAKVVAEKSNFVRIKQEDALSERLRSILYDSNTHLSPESMRTISQIINNLTRS